MMSTNIVLVASTGYHMKEIAEDIKKVIRFVINYLNI
jgi:hypothetical protein